MAAATLFRELSKAGPTDEPRDEYGRWMRDLIEQGKKRELHGTGGIVGLSRDQVAAKVRDALDGALHHQEGLHRAGSYAGAIAAKVTSYVTGLPVEESNLLEQHLAAAAGYVARRVTAHPRFRRLAAAAITRIKKSLDPDEANELKDIVASVVADTKLPHRVCCDDASLATVARGAYQHCYDRLCALKSAAAAN